MGDLSRLLSSEAAAAAAAVVSAFEGGAVDFKDEPIPTFDLLPIGTLYANPNTEEICGANTTAGMFCSVPEECAAACAHWLVSPGSDTEKTVAMVLMWMAFAYCCFNLCFYAWDYYKQSTGWEEVYVCLIEGKLSSIHAGPPSGGT